MNFPPGRNTYCQILSGFDWFRSPTKAFWKYVYVINIHKSGHLIFDIFGSVTEFGIDLHFWNMTSISKICEDVFFPAIPFPFYMQKLLQTNPVRYWRKGDDSATKSFSTFPGEPSPFSPSPEKYRKNFARILGHEPRWPGFLRSKIRNAFISALIGRCKIAAPTKSGVSEGLSHLWIWHFLNSWGEIRFLFATPRSFISSPFTLSNGSYSTGSEERTAERETTKCYSGIRY